MAAFLSFMAFSGSPTNKGRGKREKFVDRDDDRRSGFSDCPINRSTLSLRLGGAPLHCWGERGEWGRLSRRLVDLLLEVGEVLGVLRVGSMVVFEVLRVCCS